MASDHDAIGALVYAYAELLDSGDFERLADLFAAATLRSNRNAAVRRGRDEALALYRDTVLLYDGIPATKHVITNVVVEVEPGGSHAAARSYFTVLQSRPELPLQPIIAGRYHDRFARDGTAWRFADRVILVDLVGELRWHVKGVDLARS
jgi:3-phenylpropionate/cinnamic acid dioxygenase small subunit